MTGPGGIVEIPVDAGSKVGLKGFVWTLAGAYTVFNEPRWSMDVLAGFRDLQMKSSLDWHFSGPLGLLPQDGSFSRTKVLLDAIIGVKGRASIGESGHWFVPYYGDVGTGGSEVTWQLAAGVGYAFDWGDLSFDYRALHYETDGRGPQRPDHVRPVRWLRPFISELSRGRTGGHKPADIGLWSDCHAAMDRQSVPAPQISMRARVPTVGLESSRCTLFNRQNTS